MLGAGNRNKQNESTSQGTSIIPSEQNLPGVPKVVTPTTQGGLSYDKFGYAVVDLPWTLAVAYNFNYSKPLMESIINQQFTVNGSLKIATKTSLSFNSGYDITMKQITVTRIGINRSLHCWTMALNWTPVGPWKSWDFSIRINSALLSDVKYEKRKDYRDSY